MHGMRAGARHPDVTPKGVRKESQMSCSGSFRGAAVAVLLCLGPSGVAAASLKAIGGASAGAHSDSDPGSQSLTPGPDSLTLTYGAAASDSVINDSPPPATWEMKALVTGVGTARYGSLAGVAHAEASSLPANSAFLAGGSVSLNLGFTDAAEVVSDTLAADTPVTLTFLMTLEASAVHFADGLVPNPSGTGASARHEVEVRDLDNVAQPSGEGALVVNSAGVSENSTMFEFDTAVGHRLEIIADLFVSAGADVDYATYQMTQGTSDVVADQTAELFHQPSGDVRLVSESGHDYAVPEPGQALLLLFAALVLPRAARTR